MTNQNTTNINENGNNGNNNNNNNNNNVVEEDNDLIDEEEQTIPDNENWDLYQITEKSVTTVDNDVLFTRKIGSVTHAIEVKIYYEGPGVRRTPNIKSGGLNAYPIYMNITSFDKNYPELKKRVTKEAIKLATSDILLQVN